MERRRRSAGADETAALSRSEVGVILADSQTPIGLLILMEYCQHNAVVSGFSFQPYTVVVTDFRVPHLWFKVC